MDLNLLGLDDISSYRDLSFAVPALDSAALSRHTHGPVVCLTVREFGAGGRLSVPCVQGPVGFPHTTGQLGANLKLTCKESSAGISCVL